MNRPQPTLRQQIVPARWKMALPVLGLLLAAAGSDAGAQDASPARAPEHAHATLDPATPDPGTFDRISLRTSREQPYALVREGEHGVSMSGDSGDRAAVEQARHRLGGDFLWFRDDRRAWVIQDPAVLAKARAAWAPVDRLGEQMDAYGRDMDQQGRVMDALGREMGQKAGQIHPDEAKMHTLERQMDTLGREIGALGEQLAFAKGDERERLNGEMARLSARMGELGRQMGEAVRSDVQRSVELSMNDVSHRMNEAGKPMSELGRKMGALGREMERASRSADRLVRGLIRDAAARGLAQPAPQG